MCTATQGPSADSVVLPESAKIMMGVPMPNSRVYITRKVGQAIWVPALSFDLGVAPSGFRRARWGSVVLATLIVHESPFASSLGPGSRCTVMIYRGWGILVKEGSDHEGEVRACAVCWHATENEEPMPDLIVT